MTRRALARIHALVDVFEFIQRHHHARLQVSQLLLQVLHRRNVAGHDRAPRLASCRLFLNPFQIEQVRLDSLVGFITTTEVGNEQVLWVATFVHNDAAHFAFFLAHIVHMATHHVAQLFNGFGCKSNGHQFFRQCDLCLLIGGGAPAFFFIDLVNFFEELSDAVKSFQGLVFQLFQFFGQSFGATFAIVVI